MLNFSDFIQVYVLTTNHHLKLSSDIDCIIFFLFYLSIYFCHFNFFFNFQSFLDVWLPL